MVQYLKIYEKLNVSAVQIRVNRESAVVMGSGGGIQD